MIFDALKRRLLQQRETEASFVYIIAIIYSHAVHSHSRILSWPKRHDLMLTTKHDSTPCPNKRGDTELKAVTRSNLNGFLIFLNLRTVRGIFNALLQISSRTCQ